MAMSAPARTVPEFSRSIAADTISSHAQRREISAEPGERAALARRFGLVSLDRLDATLELRRQAGDIIHVSGRLMADVVQSCVVSLAPVPAHIETDFELEYGASAGQEGDVAFDPLGPDALEPIYDGQIDLGEAAAQQLAIALDPYPRAPGAVLDTAGLSVGDEKSGAKQPFAALAALKKRP
jgi:uncharacterized metal-binding protein YceD (DUF177 family)